MKGAPATTDSDAAAVIGRRRALLRWYDTARRDLPWRRRPSLYGTWIAEIMLQQTTVAAVHDRWEAFLGRFPDVWSLASASQDDVLAAWSGLGYYRRARLLHAAAREVMASGGELPTSQEGWRRLPGVGEYAAAAIASIGLGAPTAAVDANVRRVVTRWRCADAAAVAALRPRHLRELAGEHVLADRPGDWNQALMDLGAGICRAEGPRCDACPVRRWCAAGRAGTAAAVQPPGKRPAMRDVTVGALVLRRGDEVLLLPPARAIVTPARGLGAALRGEMGGLLSGTLCLPLTRWYAGSVPAPTPLLAGFRRWLRTLGVELGATIVPGPRVRHTITSHRLHVQVVRGEIAGPCGRLLAAGEWREVGAAWPRSTLVERCLGAAPGGAPRGHGTG